VVPDDTSIASVLVSIAGKYAQVAKYIPETRRFQYYIGNAKFDQFDSFEYGQGYQIYITGEESCTLTISGTMPQPSQVFLKEGYNLIFCPKSSETGVEEALLPLELGVDYTKVYHYNKAQALFEKYDSSTQQFSQLKPGESYYLYCPQDTTWVPQGADETVTTEFLYDGDGGRVRKTAGSTTTTYIGSLYERVISSTEGNSTTKHVFAGANRIATVSLRGSTSSSSLRGASAASDEAISYFHSDHLGSSNVITDQDGNQVGFTEFTPYGSTFRQEGSYDPRHKFSGKELDSSTGLYYFGARYYSHELGRFITPDTIVQAPYDPQSLNRYTYCRNNPLKYTDPTGHWWFIPFIVSAIKGAVVGAAIGAAVAAATGKNMLQGVMTGAIGGAIFGGIGHFGLEGMGQTLTHTAGGAASGAASGAITGDDIGMNAMIGGLSVGGSSYLSSNISFLAPVAGNSIGAYVNNLLRRTFMGSVIGGVVSASRGGRFGYGARQGAITSAIANSANDWMHRVEAQISEALNVQEEIRPSRIVDLTEETPASRAFWGDDPDSHLRRLGRITSRVLGRKTLGLGLSVAGESLSNRGFFEKVTTGAGAALGFSIGATIGAYEGPLSSVALGLVVAEATIDQAAIYGRVADKFWGTAPNRLAENQ